MLLQSLRVRNLLSFGPDSEALELRPLNVLIGGNGSGKSNLLEVIGLLKAAPENLSAPIKEAGGIEEWLHRSAGGQDPTGVEAEVEAVVVDPSVPPDDQRDAFLIHRICIANIRSRFELVDESITNSEHYPFYAFRRGNPSLSVTVGDIEQERVLRREDLSPEASILSQIRDPAHYSTLSHLSRQYSRIQSYRDWTFGRFSSARQPQKVGLPTDFLDPEGNNLTTVLADILPTIEDEAIRHLGALFPGITGVHTRPSGDRLQLYLKERGRLIPASRLSDGTLRYLSLLAILLHPNPPSLICIDEPELGLHPDVIAPLADLLVEASQRTQLIVTTHSSLLVEAMEQDPESVIAVDSPAGSTEFRRYPKAELQRWLEKYTMSELWSSGMLGGNSH